MKFDRRDFLKILPVAPTIISAAETKSYRGMSDSAGWRADAHKRIEQHRKDDFKVRIIESAEKPVKNLKVDISLYRHHFGFGAATQQTPESEAWHTVPAQLADSSRVFT